MLASISFSHPGGVASNKQIGTYSYTWDANKNKTKETISGQISGYSFDTTLGNDPDGYDDEDRLTYFKRSNQANPQTWTLTDVGNWSSWSNFGTSQSRTHGNSHEVLTVGSSPNHTVTTDVEGNITEIPTNVSAPARKLFWDSDNQLTGVDTTGDTTPEVTFEYDALHRRVARSVPGGTERVYIHSGQQVVCDYARGANANTTPLYRYVWGDYIDEPILRQTGSTTLLYYHHNQQYSTVALTNSSGEVVERYGYTAYGELTIMDYSGSGQSYSTYSNRYTYTGREWDPDLKLYHFRARYYEPHLGRFVSRDPIGYSDGMNFYNSSFASSGLDPFGLFNLSDWLRRHSQFTGAGVWCGSTDLVNIPLPYGFSLRVTFSGCIQATRCCDNGVINWAISADAYLEGYFAWGRRWGRVPQVKGKKRNEPVHDPWTGKTKKRKKIAGGLEPASPGFRDRTHYVSFSDLEECPQIGFEFCATFFVRASGGVGVGGQISFQKEVCDWEEFTRFFQGWDFEVHGAAWVFGLSIEAGVGGHLSGVFMKINTGQQCKWCP